MGASPAPGAYKNRGTARSSRPPCPPLPSDRFRLLDAFPPGCFGAGGAGLFDPSAEQPAQARNHTAGMLVLPTAQPAPLTRQAQIEPQLVQVGICSFEMLQTLGTATGIGLEDRLLEIQCRPLQTLRDDEALALRETLALRKQPGQEIVGLGKDDQLFVVRHL